MESTLPSAKSSPKDVFLHLFATIALYVSAGSLISLLLDYVNVLFPDPLNTYGDPGSSIRWSMAILIIVFPAYAWVSRFIRKDLVANPEKSEIRARKWLLYLTLFFASILIVGDLVALIFSFLEGELSSRFLLKVLAVLAVSAGVFWYYLNDLRTKAEPLTSRAVLFVRVAIGVVALAIIAGFFVAGSPFRQRLVRFDNQKISDLQSIQYRTVNFWQKKNVLPATVDELRDDILGFVPPKDPQSGASYEYRVTGERTFELCGEFNVPADADAVRAKQIYSEYPIGGAANESWEHGIGRTCFTRTIDPELYRVEKPLPL
jgi:hypothetical protein